MILLLYKGYTFAWFTKILLILLICSVIAICSYCL